MTSGSRHASSAETHPRPVILCITTSPFSPSRPWCCPLSHWSIHFPWPVSAKCPSPVPLFVRCCACCGQLPSHVQRWLQCFFSAGSQNSIRCPRIFQPSSSWTLFHSKNDLCLTTLFSKLSGERGGGGVGQVNPGHLVHFMLTL